MYHDESFLSMPLQPRDESIHLRFLSVFQRPSIIIVIIAKRVEEGVGKEGGRKGTLHNGRVGVKLAG